MKKTLPLTYQKRYQALKQDLGEMHQNLDLADDAGLTLKARAAALQQFFHEQILSLQMNDLAPALQDWVQSYHVEIDKQLRLLGLDVLFLQAARQSTTTQQRRQQVRDRLDTLQRYCDALLGE